MAWSDPKSCAFLPFLGSKCNFLWQRGKHSLSTSLLSLLSSSLVKLLFSAGPSAEEVFQPSQFSLLRDFPGKEGVRIAVLPLSICKIISTLISQIFWEIRKTEMWNRKSLLFVLVFDNVCNLSGWFKRFRYFLQKGSFNDKTNVIIWVRVRGVFKA